MQWLSDFAQMLASGTSIGCVYAIVALGFVLIYKASEIVNFTRVGSSLTPAIPPGVVSDADLRLIVAYILSR
mgnify:CR=1 FL=1